MSKLGHTRELNAKGRCTTFAQDGEHYIVAAIDPNSCIDKITLNSVLVHELSHAVSEIMNYHGFTCDEFRSYTLQFLYINCIGFLNNK